MSTAFSILPASTTIPLDEAGKGTASFTVTNQTGHPVRVHVSVTPVGDPLPPIGWLTPPEINERDLAIDGAAQFSVLVTVPEKSPAGTYLFRLDAVSTQLPDEEWAHSPEVHFVVPEPPEEPPPPPPPPPPARKGYVESLIGSELGAMGVGLAIGVPARILRLVAEGAGNNDLKELFELVSFIVVPLAFWVGAAIGIVWYLRRTRIDGVYETALPAGLILPIWALILLPVAFFVANVLGNFDPKEEILAILFGLLIALVPPLVGRAIYRFRTTGGL
jgi:hypothetical protein